VVPPVIFRVVAAVIERDGRYLIAQRLPKAVFAGYWEFPGGKVEPGEDDATALRREMVEELNATVEVGPLLTQACHAYDDFSIDFRVYCCSLLNEDLRPLNVADFRWVLGSELEGYTFPPADEATIAQLAGCCKGGL